MDDRTSGEIVKPELEQPARRRAVPCPMTDDGIDPTWKYSKNVDSIQLSIISEMSNREVKTQSGFNQETGDIGHGYCLPTITFNRS